MSDNNQLPHPDALVRRKQGISAVWLVPIIALVFGGWLLVKAYLEQGTLITVQFDNARGIVIGKTEVRYKGLSAGIVKNIEVSADLQSVIVEIEMVANAAKMLTNNALFWYVTADVSLQGISDLDTLLSGSYINIQPDLNAEGKPQRHFVAVKEPPMLDQSTPGLHLTLVADTLGSLAKNSPVTFKQITVGHVSGFKYVRENNKVEVGIFIKPEYASLVKQHSRFWNASGFEVSGSLTSGVHVNTESIAAIIAGGIAFDQAHASSDSSVAQNGQQFILHHNFQDAEMGHEIELELNWDSGIDNGAKIQYQALTIGKIVALKDIDPNTRKVIATARVNPRLAPYLTTESQFYVATPEISLSGVNNMHSLLTGAHIGVLPSLAGQAQKTFTVYNQQPAYRYSEPGLHLILTTSNSASLAVGSGIFYQQQKVGTIQAIEHQSANNALIHIHIDQLHQDLVTTDSQFWHASGMRINASLQGVDIQAQSLQAILTGGIAFNSGSGQQKPGNGDRFALAPDQTHAEQSVHFTLYAKATDNVKQGTKLLYQNNVVGQVHQVNTTETGSQLTVGIFAQYRDILRENSHFWLVNPKLSLAGIIDASNLFRGNYILVDAGDGPQSTSFYLSSQPVAKNHSAPGLQLQLMAPKSYGILPGSQISYKGIQVGQVDTVALAQSGDGVELTLTIAAEHAALVNDYTRFFNLSGIAISGNLSQFSMQTDALDSIVKGGLSFYTPEKYRHQAAIKDGHSFTLFANQATAEMAGIAVTIHFNNIAGLSAHQAIKYHGQTIGRVERIMPDNTGMGATVFAYINSAYQRFSFAGAQFWHTSPQLNLIDGDKLSNLMAGEHIQALPGQDKPQTHFEALDYPPAISSLSYGVNLTLTAKKLGSVRVGNPVMYRQVVVGKVIGVDLSKHADRVNIYINIAKRYAPLITNQSKFWNASGFEFEAGLFSGVEFSAESLASILTGGIAFATPEPAEPINSQAPSQPFTLHDQPKSAWLDWAPKIQLTQ